MRLADANIVRSLPLFSGMQDAHFETLIEAGYLQRFPHGVALAHEGERPNFLHVLVEGSVEFYSVSRDRETTLSFLKPPAAFILAAVVLDQLYLKSARTTESSVVVLIPAEAVRDVFDKDPAFARSVVAELALRYRGLVKDLKNQRLRTGLERLANWILAHNEQLGAPGIFQAADREEGARQPARHAPREPVAQLRRACRSRRQGRRRQGDDRRHGRTHRVRKTRPANR